MGGQDAWVTREQSSRDAMSMPGVREPLSGLNTAHLESLLGQEVVITLGDASTRQGTVCDVDRRGTVALRKPRPPLIRESDAAGSSDAGRDHVCVIPRDAVKGVEVVGGGAMALDALRQAGGSDRRGSLDVSREPTAKKSAGANETNAPFGRAFFSFSSIRPNPAAVQSSGAFLETRVMHSHGAEFKRRSDTSEPREPKSEPSTPRSLLTRRGSNEENASDANGETMARLARVRLALENARVPVHLDMSAASAATLTVMGCCVVPPPYTPEACACANAKVLERVRELVAEAR